MSRPRGFDLNHALDAAMSTFWEKGYTATSAQDLVDSTGLGRGSLYNTFGSKRALFESALQRYESEWTSRLVEPLEEGEEPALGRIRTALLSVAEEELAPAPEHRGCLVVNSAMELAGMDPEVTELVRRNFARVETALALCVQQGQREGTITNEQDPRRLAQYLLNSLYGLRVLGKVADRQTLTGVVDTVMLPL